MQARHSVALAAIVLAAGGVGFRVGRSTATPESGDAGVAETPRAAAPSPRASERSSADKPRLERPNDATTAGDALRKLVPDASAERIADADARAAKIRLDAQARSDAADKIAARQIADEIAEERAFLVDKERGGTMAMLRALKGSGAHPFELVNSPERFGALFERKSSGPQIDGHGLRYDSPIADGATITFGEGLHSWNVRQLGCGKPFPKDLLVVGAGMDATMVRLDEFNASDVVASLTFRDMTIDCGDEYMFDLRSDNPVTLRLERCRVVGFDMGAGGSVMLSANTAAFFASDSRFEAGFGNMGSDGNLFRARDGLLVRMERCTFVGPFNSVFDADSDATYDFVDCNFANCKDDWHDIAAVIAGPPVGVRFERCKTAEVAKASVAGARLAFLSKIAAASDPPIDLLQMLERYHQRLTSLVRDRAAFAALFDLKTTGRVIDGASGVLSGDPPAAVSVAFPAGAFEWRQSERLPGFDGDLALTGQGMNTTLVRLQDHLDCSRLTLRDLTLDVREEGLPERPDRIRVERCRVVGFDKGAGSGTLFAPDGASAIFAEDSRFESGYGRAPAGGRLIRCGRESAARFERCVIRVPGDDLRSSDCSLVFVACRFVDVAPELKPMFDEVSPDIVLADCGVDYAAGATATPLSLADINPAWADARRR